MTMGECAVRDQRNPIIDGVCAGCGARVREPLSVLTMPDDSCPLCSAGASIRRALLAVRGEALDWSTRLFSIECSERWARGASERADDEGRDDLAAKLRGCESGLAHGGDAIRALIQTRARLAEVEAERDAARAGVEELRLTLAAEQGRPEGAPAGWEWTGGMWRRNGYPHAVTARHYGPTNQDQPWQWEVWDTRPALDVRLLGKGYAPTARAAMLAADAVKP